ncbi:LysR substrate-binding domain-containing protein [Salmonella enterica]|uniref:LysR substrate-binding domain-containing protein n=1 Tax=Salmonella enterica TaxID=28901 RepID=UPI0035278200
MRHWLAVVSLVSQGLGVALVPQAMAHSRLPGAVFRPVGAAVAQSEAYAVWPAAPENPLVGDLMAILVAGVPAGAPGLTGRR